MLHCTKGDHEDDMSVDEVDSDGDRRIEELASTRSKSNLNSREGESEYIPVTGGIIFCIHFPYNAANRFS